MTHTALARLVEAARGVVQAADHDTSIPVTDLMDGIILAVAELRLAFSPNGAISRRLNELAVVDPAREDALDDLATVVEIGLEQVAQLATRSASLKEERP